MVKKFTIEQTKVVTFFDVPHLKVTELGTAEPVPYSNVGQPRLKLASTMSQPWLDHRDLKFLHDTNGTDIGHPAVAMVGVYEWRDTRIHVYVNNETLEIIDIWEQR